MGFAKKLLRTLQQTKMEKNMKFMRYLLPLAMAASFVSTHAFATLDQDGSRFLEELNTRDFDALKEFVNSKRTIDVAEKSCNLVISGDVRSQWRHICEKIRGNKVRGGNANDPVTEAPISRNDFDVMFNLRFDYSCERAWAVAHLLYDNSAGVDDNGHPGRATTTTVNNGLGVGSQSVDPEGYHGSGHGDDLSLRKAYFGYNICCDGNTRFDVEIGRRNLYNVFDSQVQFLSRFDGILLDYRSKWECVADWYWKLAGFLVDERVNHFGWATEFGLTNICDTNIDFKYSFIDWRKNGRNRFGERNPAGFKFLNSQFTLCYHLDPELICAPAKLYGAFLINHNGHRSHNKNKNKGWYVGFTVGEVLQECDWAVDFQYQVVQANAVPDGDVSGIGRGNTLNESMTSNVRRGNTNYKGWKIEALYALTDNLSVDTSFEWSRSDNDNIGGRHHYSQFEIEAIYAF